MSRNKAISLYLIGTLGQIWMMCSIVFILRNLSMVVDYTTPVGMVAIGIGGVSSALWGTIVFVLGFLLCCFQWKISAKCMVYSHDPIS